MSEPTAIEKVKAWPGSVKKYVGELRDEMKLVTWPSWKQVRATTSVVIAAIFAFAVYFGVVDYLVGMGIDQVFKRFTS